MLAEEEEVLLVKGIDIIFRISFNGPVVGENRALPDHDRR